MHSSRFQQALSRIAYILVVAFGGLVVAVGIQRSPVIIGGLLFFGLFIIAACIKVKRLPKIFLVAQGLLLGIYAFLGRGGAYLGVPPLFVGEICLALGLVTVTLGAVIGHIRKIPVVWILLAFIALGAIRTLPFISQYGIMALRDAVIWGYAVFAIIVASCLLRTGWMERSLTWYGRILPWFILWVPAAYMLERGGAPIPKLPISGQRILDYKPGDMLVHLAGVGAFLLLGLYEFKRRRRQHTVWFKEWPLWVAWMIGFVLAGTRSRGGMLAAGFALVTVLVLKPTHRWARITLIGIVLVTMALLLDTGFNRQSERQVSIEQFKRNIESIYSDDAAEGMVGTREWRLNWWGEIIGYTFNGPYFWNGKGFGMTLFTDINPGAEDAELRSPHNFHMTVLARMGVPGFALWVVLNIFFVTALLRGYFRMKARDEEFWVRVNVWLLIYWVACIVNATFDVYLEGPQGAIWFWSIFGAGIAALRMQGLQHLMIREGGLVNATSPPPHRKDTTQRLKLPLTS